ncbi:hypothetical protein BDN72DRAFT_210487 [Pluteus cervinus]|uniref:Uncharacterized protein n=1 Tax=Pluteus cervinus TaxID=181527 RepID=A0ACD3AHJ6_9AGAR|nr:hypothetical protein BDN72DRAFT_210487 [Pluteus cervinus]
MTASISVLTLIFRYPIVSITSFSGIIYILPISLEETLPRIRHPQSLSTPHRTTDRLLPVYSRSCSTMFAAPIRELLPANLRGSFIHLGDKGDPKRL